MMSPVTVYGLALSSAWPVLRPSWGAIFEGPATARAPRTIYGVYFGDSGSSIGVSTWLPTGHDVRVEGWQVGDSLEA